MKRFAYKKKRKKKAWVDSLVIVVVLIAMIVVITVTLFGQQIYRIDWSCNKKWFDLIPEKGWTLYEKKCHWLTAGLFFPASPPPPLLPPPDFGTSPHGLGSFGPGGPASTNQTHRAIMTIQTLESNFDMIPDGPLLNWGGGPGGGGPPPPDPPPPPVGSSKDTAGSYWVFSNLVISLSSSSPNSPPIRDGSPTTITS